jgi:hypothetical protein
MASRIPVTSRERDFERRVRHLIEALEQAGGQVPLPVSVTDAMGPVISALRRMKPGDREDRGD